MFLFHTGRPSKTSYPTDYFRRATLPLRAKNNNPPPFLLDDLLLNQALALVGIGMRSFTHDKDAGFNRLYYIETIVEGVN